jgi:NADH:ubiquinone oxidoreductase subunit
MNNTNFTILVSNSNEREFNLLNAKAKEYSTNDDRLINFKETAEMMKTTPEWACWNLATKHLQSVRKMLCEADLTKEYIDEKTGDIRNYMLLLKAILFEKHNIEV